MSNEPTALSLVAVASSPQRDERDAGPGWFDSSWELRCGLEVREGWSEDDRVRGRIEEYLSAQRAVARTVSPSASTAIA